MKYVIVCFLIAVLLALSAWYGACVCAAKKYGNSYQYCIMSENEQHALFAIAIVESFLLIMGYVYILALEGGAV